MPAGRAIEEFLPEYLTLDNYNPGPAIKFEVKA